MNTEQEIRNYEEQLQSAMLTSDVESMDALIDDELLFTNHMGTRLSKAQDLASHRSGDFVFHALNNSDMHIRVMSDCAVVSVKSEIKGSYQGAPANGSFMFTRVWRRTEGNWRVVAGHSCLVND